MRDTDVMMHDASQRPLKILLMGDASNYHRTLAEGLRRLGHHVVVASDGTAWMNTERDIDLSRKLPGKFGGLQLWMKMQRIKARAFTGFDIVSVNGVCFAPLRPVRLQAFLRYLVANNRRVFVTLLATDSKYVEVCCGPDAPLRYSEWQIDGKPAPLLLTKPDEKDRWLAEGLYNLSQELYDTTCGAVTALYEYHQVARRWLPDSKLAYGGIPVDTKSIDYVGANPSGRKVRMLLGRHTARSLEKGTDRLLVAAQKVAARHPDKCELRVIDNIPYIDYLQQLRESDLVLDQIYSYTPATNALLAMAMGKTVVSGGEPEYYDFINEHDNRPILNAMPDDDEDLYRLIADAVNNPQRFNDLAPRNREFVIKHNDVDAVAARFMDFWKTRL